MARRLLYAAAALCLCRLSMCSWADDCVTLHCAAGTEAGAMQSMDGTPAADCAVCYAAGYTTCHRPHAVVVEVVMCLGGVPTVCHTALPPATADNQTNEATKETFCTAGDEVAPRSLPPPNVAKLPSGRLLVTVGDARLSQTEQERSYWANYDFPRNTSVTFYCGGAGGRTPSPLVSADYGRLVATGGTAGGLTMDTGDLAACNCDDGRTCFLLYSLAAVLTRQIDLAGDTDSAAVLISMRHVNVTLHSDEADITAALVEGGGSRFLVLLLLLVCVAALATAAYCLWRKRVWPFAGDRPSSCRLCADGGGSGTARHRWLKFAYAPAANGTVDSFTMPVRDSVAPRGDELLLNESSDEIVEYGHLLGLCPMVLPARLHINEPIGRTRFGAIHKGTLVGDSRTDVMLHSVTSPYRLRVGDARALNEALSVVAKAGSHENIVSVLGLCDQDLRLLIAMELVPGPNLQTVLRESRTCDNKGNTGDFAMTHRVASLLAPARLSHMMLSCADGCRHLCERGVHHGHLAAVNVLLAGGGRPKIAGFAFASTYELYAREGDRRHSALRWHAPEILGGDALSPTSGEQTAKSVVWSLGVLMWELATLGGTPYAETESAVQLIESVGAGALVPRRLPSIHDKLYCLLLGCWKMDVEQRYSPDQLLQSMRQLFDSEGGKVDLSLDTDGSFEYATVRTDLEVMAHFHTS